MDTSPYLIPTEDGEQAVYLCDVETATLEAGALVLHFFTAEDRRVEGEDAAKDFVSYAKREGWCLRADPARPAQSDRCLLLPPEGWAGKGWAGGR